MKRILLFLFCCFSFSSFTQITYVNELATGANDGRNWANAFNNLDTALFLANEFLDTEEIWIAKGTYLPDNNTGDTLSTFKISTPLKLYGGFNGTETSLDERDPSVNRTILSGDLNQDDIAEDLSANRQDNCNHVVFIDSLLNSPVILDGLEITGGQTNTTSEGDETFWRGGGIFSYSTIEVNDCDFYGNVGRSGAAIYVSPFGGGGGSNSKFINSNFSNNAATSQGAGIFFSEVSNIVVGNCNFTNNNTVRGALYPLRSDNILIDNCYFERNRNTTTETSGGAIFNFRSTNILLINSEFRDNSAFSGGAIYSSNSTIPVGIQAITIENCLFEDNEAIDFGGGAVYNWQGQVTINECDFINNSSANSGAGMFSNTDDKKVIIMNSTFTGGTCNFGGAHSCYGENGQYELTNNSYSDGVVQTSGGAVIFGFLSNSIVKECTFENNSARFGGACYMQNDTTKVRFENCLFNTNTAMTNTGGAINASDGTTGEIIGCTFFGNLADFGGAVSSFDNMAPLQIKNSIFDNNRSSTQGGALNVFDSQVEIENSVFSFNENSGLSGGAISNNAGDSISSEVEIINSTFYENYSELGSSIGQFTTDLSSFAIVTTQNSLYISEEEEYGIESGTPEIVSNGGNISNDDSFNPFFSNINDINDEFDPVFIDPDDNNFVPIEGGAAINNGIAEGAPVLDILGNGRVGALDAGAFENINVSTKEVILSNKDHSLQIFPNPVKDFANIKIDNNWKGNVLIEIYTINGELLIKKEVDKSSDLLDYNHDFSLLPNGVHQINAVNNNERLVMTFIKM